LAVPSAPDLTKLTPLTETWRAGVEIWRVHEARFHPDAFNPTASTGRFRPFTSGSRVVTTMYGADSIAPALSETVFHDLDPRAADQVVIRTQLLGLVRSVVVPSRDLTLISLRGAGLRRLRAGHAELIETDPSTYPETAAYARALYRAGKADGLIWSSRLYPGSPALMLFGTRVRGRSLDYNIQQVEPLWKGRGFEEVAVAADAADITISL
jgi:hypothetical protein